MTDLDLPPRVSQAPDPEPLEAPRARSRWQRGYRLAVILGDVGAGLCAAGLAHLSRHGFSGRSLVFGSERLATTTVVLAAAALWLLCTALSACYERRTLGAGTEEYRRVLVAGIRLLAVVGLAVFLTNVNFSRQFVLVFVPVVVALSLLARYLARRVLHRGRARGHHLHRVLAVGPRAQVRSVGEHFDRPSYLGYRVVGACLLDGSVDPVALTPTVGATREVRVAGHADDLRAAAQEVDADTVLVVGSHDSRRIERAARQLEGTKLDLVVAADVIDVAGPRISVAAVGGIPLLYVEPPRLSGFPRACKDLSERAVAVVTLILAAPLLALCALVVRLTSPGPALFRQTRIGRDGKPFTLVKLRTMHQHAEAQASELALRNEKDGQHFKIRDDPRVTRFGRFLRRWSLDELPQLWCVLRGDMALVGPRPPLPAEVADYDERALGRLRVKPGITGLWQVSGRADLPWAETVRLDLYYIDNWSIGLDIVIMLRTLTAVLRRRGAY